MAAAEDNLYFVHFEVDEQRVNLVQIAPRVKVDLLGGYHDYEIRSVYPLLRLEQKDDQFMTAAYSFALNEVVDRVVGLTGLTADEQIKNKRGLQKQIGAEIKLKLAETGEWDRELLALYFFLNKGVTVRMSSLEEGGWGGFNQQNFSKVRQAGCSVVVINSTTTSGLANRIAAVLEKDGYLVTRTGNFAEPLVRTTIYYDSGAAACMELISRSIKVFPLEPVLVGEEELPQRYRAGVVVIAGEDLVGKNAESQ
jgi:hypothetical protein